jgi:hypothetical protein
MDFVNILFWNIGEKDFGDEIAAYAQKHEIDIIVLLEDHIPQTKLLTTLNKKANKYYFCNSNRRRISIYTSFDSRSFKVKETNSSYLSLVEFEFLRKKILFGGIHLPSKLTLSTSESQAYVAHEVKLEVEFIEDKIGHTNTVLVGDFNMNPFELGMVAPNGFNSVMSRQIASAIRRKVSGLGIGSSRDYHYFYNPMWSYLGDLSNFSPGTYYFYEDSFDNHYRWNMLDQILIRPSLMGNFVANSLQIIESDVNGNALIDDTKRTRAKEQLCDHLPVVFSMDLTK